MKLIDIILLAIIFGYIGFVLFNFNHFNDDQCSSNCRTCNLVNCRNANPIKRRKNNELKKKMNKQKENAV